MASQLAILLAAPSADEDDNPNEDAVTWCDSKLQEVREVLADLLDLAERVGESETCQRARELMKRLKTE